MSLNAARAYVDEALAQVLSAQRLAGSPPHLTSAVRHAVFPGGGRVRPLLSLAVARACGMDDARLSMGGACAVELVHCASLVHDDMPIFDDASERRGRPTVHVLFGQQVALLAGDALIVHAFEAIAEAAERHPARGIAMTRMLVAGVGMPGGIIGGQAWESEPRVDREAYQRAKTGALFRASLQMGAISAGAQPAPWAEVGDRIGLAYQLADDLHDAVGAGGGKPVGQDERLGRPSVVRERGLSGAVQALEEEIEAGIGAIPSCQGRSELAALLRDVAGRLLPDSLRESRRAVG